MTLTHNLVVTMPTVWCVIKFVRSPFVRCFMWHNSLGATAVYLSWIGLVLVMRKFPKLGIYVVMFTDIFKTFAQFFVVCFLFIVAFSLGFHILLYDQVCIVCQNVSRRGFNGATMFRVESGYIVSLTNTRNFRLKYNHDYESRTASLQSYVILLRKGLC